MATYESLLSELLKTLENSPKTVTKLISDIPSHNVSKYQNKTASAPTVEVAKQLSKKNLAHAIWMAKSASNPEYLDFIARNDKRVNVKIAVSENKNITQDTAIYLLSFMATSPRRHHFSEKNLTSKFSLNDIIAGKVPRGVYINSYAIIDFIKETNDPADIRTALVHYASDHYLVDRITDYVLAANIEGFGVEELFAVPNLNVKNFVTKNLQSLPFTKEVATLVLQLFEGNEDTLDKNYRSGFRTNHVLSDEVANMLLDSSSVVLQKIAINSENLSNALRDKALRNGDIYTAVALAEVAPLTEDQRNYVFANLIKGQDLSVVRNIFAIHGQFFNSDYHLSLEDKALYFQANPDSFWHWLEGKFEQKPTFEEIDFFLSNPGQISSSYVDENNYPVITFANKIVNGGTAYYARNKFFDFSVEIQELILQKVPYICANLDAGTLLKKITPIVTTKYGDNPEVWASLLQQLPTWEGTLDELFVAIELLN